MATELKQKVSKDTVDSGMNRFEKVGQALYKYSSEMEDDSSAVVLKTAKEVFDNAGQKHRTFRINMLEKVQKPMKEWIEVILTRKNFVDSLIQTHSKCHFYRTLLI